MSSQLPIVELVIVAGRPGPGKSAHSTPVPPPKSIAKTDGVLNSLAPGESAENA